MKKIIVFMLTVLLFVSNISIPTFAESICPKCEGSGVITETRTCSQCAGKGYYSIHNEVMCRTCRGGGYIGIGYPVTEITKKCPHCLGKNGNIDPNCYACNGTGWCTYKPAFSPMKCDDCNGKGIIEYDNTITCNLCTDGKEKYNATCTVCNGYGILYDRYTITYDANGGSNAPSNQIKKKGEVLTLTDVKPEREGYAFMGWALISTGGVAYNAGDIYETDADITLYAVWKELQRYTIHYDTEGGIGDYPDQIKYEGIETTISNLIPDKEGYKFLGWSLAPNDIIVYQPKDVYTADEDVTLYAVWEKLPEYIIHYDANEGTGAPSDQIKYHGTRIQLSNVKPSRNGYIFKGWSQLMCGDVLYKASYINYYYENADLTLYAVWGLKCDNCEGSGHTNNIIKCNQCDGDGVMLITKCNYCNGSGKDRIWTCNACYGTGIRKIQCGKCDGTGKVKEDCSTCNGTGAITINNHIFSEWSTKESANCVQKGIKVRTCTICGKQEEEIVEKTAHAYIDTIIEPTCTEKGYTIHDCSVCEESYSDTYTEATGHSYGEWTVSKPATCTKEGEQIRECSICGKTETKEIEKIAHKYADTIVPPICTEQGYTVHRCSACGYSYNDTYTEAPGHSFGEWIVSKPATCTEEGEQIKECAICGEKELRIIEKLEVVTSANEPITSKQENKETQSNVIITLSKVKFTLTAGKKKVSLKWSKVKGASGYTIYYKTSKKSSWKKLKNVSAKKTSYVKKKLKSKKTYYFTVKAYKIVNGKKIYGGFSTKKVKTK